jgi:hypothetical protein
MSDLLTVLRTSFKVGLISSGRKRYWRLLVRAFRRTPRFVSSSGISSMKRGVAPMDHESMSVVVKER